MEQDRFLLAELGQQFLLSFPSVSLDSRLYKSVLYPLELIGLKVFEFYNLIKLHLGLLLCSSLRNVPEDSGIPRDAFRRAG